MDIICFGDSNTYGYNPDDTVNMRYKDSDIWVNILGELLKTNTINLGRNGRTVPQSEYEIAQLDLFISRYAHKKLIIMIGTNDLLQEKTPECISLNLVNFINKLQLNSEDIILISPPPLKEGTRTKIPHLFDNYKALIDGLAGIAENIGVKYIDVSLCSIPLTSDGVHFTKEAHELFALSLYKLLKKLPVI